MQYGGGVNVIANPSGASGPTEHRAGGIGAVQAHPPHVVPVEKTSLETMSVTVAEAPPVTELVTESPLENGLSASNIGVIGGNKIHFSPLFSSVSFLSMRESLRTFFIADKGFP